MAADAGSWHDRRADGLRPHALAKARVFRKSRGFVYLVLAENVPCDEVEPIDVELLERDLDGIAPGWRTGDAGFTVDLSTVCAEVTVGSGERGDHALECVRGLATRRGLDIFDPQAERITARDRRAAADCIESHQEVATEEQVGVWMRAAAGGDADAMNELGTAYSFGEGVRENATLAAQHDARAAAAGHPVAMANLAECYRTGEGVAQDAPTAIRWFEQAGARGNLEALVRLAELRRSGEGVPQNAAAARRILEQASEKDGQVSAFLLAEMWEAGEGGERDLEQARRLYRIALANRHPEARARLRRLGVDA